MSWEETKRYVITAEIELEIEAWNEGEAYETAQRILDGISAHIDPMRGLTVHEAARS